MGSYAKLWLSKHPSPQDDEEAIDEIYAKWDVPLGWLALLEPVDWKFLVPADYKPGLILPAWHWFGGPPISFDDWGRPENPRAWSSGNLMM